MALVRKLTNGGFLLIWLLSDYNIEVDRFGLNKKDTGSPYTVRNRGIR